MLEIARQGPNTCDLRTVPIIVVPGVMGSRLQFSSPGWLHWDPDDKASMVYLAGLSAEGSRNTIGWWKAADVMTTSTRLSPDEIAHMFAGVVTDFYVPFCRHVRDLTTLCATTPVYAVGYDWRQANSDSSDWLDQQITTILDDNKADEFILISHSMGGLVSRACLLKHSGNSAKLQGVIHICQPVTGAPTFYRRMYTGAEAPIDGGPGVPGKVLVRIQGASPSSFQIVMSGLPGPSQLIPTSNYRDTGGGDWLWDGRVVPPHPWSAATSRTGSIFDWYLGAGGPPGIWWAVKAGSKPADDLQTNMKEADTFHAWLGTFKHANTWSIYSTGLETDMAVQFGTGSKNKGVVKSRRNEGDGTVPATSASSLFTAAETSNDATGAIFVSNQSMRQCELTGIEHGAACNDSIVQTVVEQMLLVILGCVCPDPPQGILASDTTDQMVADNADGQAPSNSDDENDAGNGDSDSSQLASADQGNTPSPSDWSADDQTGTT